ncbi:hypothetical protein G8A07_14720 [Roseateles sp. DAIF2]|uniref:hypothetical protein n=1 Tax=Roseateles sp. DAIF2 TaxID=2714952 RepID=UPI0018A29379|nr:hypothetical protein [Roseateles sp. DAIF2]QPF74044.1 hypothetical protein G8A07_14720 [Roseateles sp. DAIF2]
MNRSDLQDTPTPVTQIVDGELNPAAAHGSEAVRKLMTKAGDAAQRSVEHMRDLAETWRDGASAHVRTHPVRSVLIATGTGLLLALLVRALRR